MLGSNRPLEGRNHPDGNPEEPNMSDADRIRDLIAKMTLEEKVSQLSHSSPAVERLGIPEYNWWNEALHGVARAGLATVFPQAIGLAATFDDRFVRRVFDAVSDEARAKYNLAVARGIRGQYQGLTYWTPNINIFRDPRWGRGQETYGEDPCLTARMGVAVVKGLQGGDRTGGEGDRLKLAACAKHYAVHSGPEKDRHTFDAVVSQKDLWETYLPAFRALVSSGVESVMGAYNRTLGEACNGSKYLLKDILRGRWRFRGHVVSDCWAIKDFHDGHNLTKTPEESVALAINSGCDLNCGSCYPALVPAVAQGLVQEKTIDESLTRLLETRFRLGQFDAGSPGGKAGPWDSLGAESVHSEAHVVLALEAARKSLVLLKNRNGILPIDGKKKKILVIGPSAASVHAIMGNYHGYSPRLVTILEGITEKLAQFPEVTMDYHQGCMAYDENRNTGWTVGMAEQADLVIACFGLDNAMEGEEGDAIASSSKGDRDEIELPEWQLAYLRALSSRGTPLVLVLTGGSPIAIPEDIAEAILFAWYPGEQGGTAVADALFGAVSPSGKLPITFPASTSQLPPYEDYAMAGRTYRYMDEEPLWPFGFGLSYAKFRFDSIRVVSSSLAAGPLPELALPENAVTVEVTVANESGLDAEEVIQIYVEKADRKADDPLCSLRDFRRVSVPARSSVTERFTLDRGAFASVLPSGEETVLKGSYRVVACDAAPLPVSAKKGASNPVRVEVSAR